VPPNDAGPLTYQCNFDPTTYNPNGPCIYNRGSGSNYNSGISNCTPNGDQIGCTITTCVGGGQYSQARECGTGTHGPNSFITVQIDQQCTPVSQLPSQSLICEYGVGGVSQTYKDVPIQVKCQSQDPTSGIICTTTDPYNRQITRTCQSPDPSGNYTCTITNPKNTASSSSSSNTALWSENCTPPLHSNRNIPHCTVFSAPGNVQLGILDCSSTTTCTITDDSGNTMTLTCTAFTSCTSSTPDCPHTDPFPKASDSINVGESNIACDGSLVVDLFMGSLNGTMSSQVAVTIRYPLSEFDLEFILNSSELGLGSQTWTQQQPQANYLSLRH